MSGKFYALHHACGHSGGRPGSEPSPPCGAGITVNPTSGLETTEDLDSDSFTVVLDTQPTDDVTIDLSSSDTTEGTVSPTSLTFTNANWESPQSVTVTGVDDALEDGDIAYSIVTAAAVSTDGDYSGLNAADVGVTNVDNDGATPVGADCYATGQTDVKCQHPVPIGVTTGHQLITAGTIGARVMKGGNVYALSNNHVYAASNAASNAANVGDNVLQPGAFDGGVDPDDAIGTLEPYTALIFNNTVSYDPDGDTSTCNFIDAAIALSSTSMLGNSTPSDGYGIPQSTTIEASINQKVKKHGRTTGQTKGTVQGIGFTVDVDYGAEGVARFVNQIIISPGSFSAGGDSGSLIVDDSKGRAKANAGRPVGLLFAGSQFNTIANPINVVLTEYGVTIDGN